MAGALGLFAHGVEGGAWLFHLTNTLLHAVNAILVYFLIRMLERNRRAGGEGISTSADSIGIIAVIGALVFAVHPLQVEVVAWVNGRMMLLSTLFGLLTLLAT